MVDRLKEAEAELAALTPKVTAADKKLAELQAVKEEASEVVETAKAAILEYQPVRDALRREEMALQTEIGQIQGVPELRVN